jgi:hypothetical protein
MGPLGLTETSVRDYHYSLRNGPEERSTQAVSPFPAVNETQHLLSLSQEPAICHLSEPAGSSSKLLFYVILPFTTRSPFTLDFPTILRVYFIGRKVAGSIPDGVIEIFCLHNPSDRTMALESTQPLTEMSTRSISWG